MHTNRIALLSLVVAAGTARAGGSYYRLSTDAKYVAPFTVDTGASSGIVIEDSYGYFFPMTFSAKAGWVPTTSRIPGTHAYNGLGLSVAVDYDIHALYVFETEDGGIYSNYSLDNGVTWRTSWCHISSDYQFDSAPAAVYVGSNAFRVYARASDALIEIKTNGCGEIASQVIGATLAPPIALSWGPGRVDIFGTYGATLEWIETSDATNYQTHTSFQMSDGTMKSFTVANAPGSLAATTPGSDRLEVVFCDGHHVWRLGYVDGWFIQPLLTASSAMVSAANEFDDPYETPAAAAVFTEAGQPVMAFDLNDDGTLAAHQLQVPGTTFSVFAEGLMSTPIENMVYGISGTNLYVFSGLD
ncbi:MAG TPA: hypothetical protein VLX92_00615 [Kofleriaceae bacterium]|nr:hypothetical protein [Kofleriaceae bacterium]